ncbi:MAG TPA: pirin-like C-terminal cupin domain-containing protein, partial [Terriglobales bacterium]|nr:pirin-like C-terminal cupin domain-containing protein [Terriglobales bacterium]
FVGLASPVPTHSPMLYVDVRLPAGATLPLDTRYAERGAYVVEGRVLAGGQAFEAGQMLVFTMGAAVELSAFAASRLVLFGGEPLGQRFVWWNFVSSRKERILQAADDWKAGRFPGVPGETEFIPLPERAPPAVDYP